MADNRLDELAAQFAQNKQREDLVAFMDEVEKSVVLVPAQLPPVMSPQVQEALRTGAALPVEKGNEPKICLLQKEGSRKVFPIFTSRSQIPKEKMPAAILNMPFPAIINMMMANKEEVKEIVVNPFTHGIVLNENLIDLADKRFKAMANPSGPQSVALTESQFHAVAHVKLGREKLPAKFFKDTEQAISDIKLKKEKFIVDLYKSIYPAELECPYTEDDIAVMTLQVEDGLYISRVDTPDNHLQAGAPVRIYITFGETADNEVNYFLIEKGDKNSPNMISRMDKNGMHTPIMEAPENGAEIETIMSLINPS